MKVHLAILHILKFKEARQVLPCGPGLRRVYILSVVSIPASGIKDWQF